MLYPFRTRLLSGRHGGKMTMGPPKIVHHTTEGGSISGALGAFRETGSWPHFVVSEDEIVQCIDTAYAARALKNDPNDGIETNADGCVQVEVVGYARKPKSIRTLANVARLCRWIETTHDVARVWPNGLPKVATKDGRDPGGHNRNAKNWDTKSGHYGHCHVPENSHWDPAYTAAEVALIMGKPTEPRNYNQLEVDVKLENKIVTVTLGAKGNGYVDVNDIVVSAVPKVDDPSAGDYRIPRIALAEVDGRTRVVVSEGTPSGAAKVRLVVAR